MSDPLEAKVNEALLCECGQGKKVAVGRVHMLGCPAIQRPAVLELVRAERKRVLEEALNTPEVEDFDKAIPLESAHQNKRWGVEHDATKEPEQWFWVVGYLAGKALCAFKSGDLEKAKHHCISTAALLRNWHAHIRALAAESGAASRQDEITYWEKENERLEGMIQNLQGELAKLRAPMDKCGHPGACWRSWHDVNPETGDDNGLIEYCLWCAETAKLRELVDFQHRVLEHLHYTGQRGTLIEKALSDYAALAPGKI